MCYINFIGDNAMLKTTHKIIGTIVTLGVMFSSLNAETITHNGFTYGTVTSPYTGRVWLDRNLGASEVCTAFDDSACYGDYYQWGRGTDGHEKATSEPTRTLATDILNAGDKFITDMDWVAFDQGVDVNGTERYINLTTPGVLNICPVGFKVPSYEEVLAETVEGVQNIPLIYYGQTMFDSFLKLPFAGYRDLREGEFKDLSKAGHVWTTQNYDAYIAKGFYFDANSTNGIYTNKAFGYSIRCTQDLSYIPSTAIETLDYLGSYSDSISYIQPAKTYQFTVDEKLRVTFETTAIYFEDTSFISDSNGTLLVTAEDKYTSSLIDVILDAGTYSFTVASKNDTRGDFSFTFTATTSLTQDEYVVDLPGQMILHYGGVSKLLLDTTKFTNPNFIITSTNLPNTWKIEKDEWNQINLIINEIPSNSFDVDFQVLNSEIAFDNTYTIHFTQDSYSVEAIRGVGEGSSVAIKVDENNITVPIKLSFDLLGDESRVASVECFFGTEGYSDYIGFSSTSSSLLVDNLKHYECDAGQAVSFIGATDLNDFMNKLNGIGDDRRYLTLKINQNDATTITTSDYQSIPIEYTTLGNNYIKLIDAGMTTFGVANATTEIEIQKSGERFFTIRTITKGEVVLLDVNDTIVLHYGEWNFRIGDHLFSINIEDENSNFLLKLERDNLTNTDLLNYDFVNSMTSERAFELTGKRVKSLSSSIIENFHIFRKWLGKGDYFNETFSDTTTAVRGTTFVISGDSNNSNIKVLEGLVDINQSGVVTALQSMEQFDLLDTNKTMITSLNLLPSTTAFLDSTTLFQTDLNSTISKLQVIANIATANYVLIGKNVQLASGSVNTFDTISEGNYTLHFFEKDGYEAPLDINFTFNRDNLFDSVSVLYKLIQNSFLIENLDSTSTISEDGNITLDRNGIHLELYREADGKIYHFSDVNGTRTSVYINIANAEIEVDARGQTLTSFTTPKVMSVKVLADGTVSPSIDGSLLPKADLPAGTTVEFSAEKVKFTVPMAEKIEF